MQKTHVVFVEMADVFDAEFNHRHALDAKAKSKASVFFGIVADVFQNAGMNHAAAAQLEPLAVKEYIEFGRWFGEREIVWAKAGLQTALRGLRDAFKKLVQENCQCAFEIAESHAFIDQQGTVLACGTCIRSRNQKESDACPISTMIDCLNMVEWADKVITF